MKKILHSFILFVFVVNALTCSGTSYAQGILLPEPGTIVHTSAAFTPLILKGLTVIPQDPFRLDFILDTGNSGLESEGDAALRAESQKLIKYFLASLALPEEEQWVNLSPYEKDRILPGSLGKTELGRDMLAQDYFLKQITASLIYPDSDLGKSFWAKVYERAQKEVGTTDIPVDTFNKVWITADKANVYVKGNTAFIVGSHLKVMLESDYSAQQKAQGAGHMAQEDACVGAQCQVPGASGSSELAKQVVREVILPELEKEVNEGKNFAALRQMFHSMILATWYKKNLKKALLAQVYADQKKTIGIEGTWVANKAADVNPQAIWSRYEAAYKKGVFNFIREEADPATGAMIPRKYFSGGVKDLAMAKEVPDGDPGVQDLAKKGADGLIAETVQLQSAAPAGLPVEAQKELDVLAIPPTHRDLVTDIYRIFQNGKSKGLPEFLAQSKTRYSAPGSWNDGIVSQVKTIIDVTDGNIVSLTKEQLAERIGMFNQSPHAFVVGQGSLEGETVVIAFEAPESVLPKISGRNPVIILVGAPGAGKGTISTPLKAKLGMHQISTGDIFRDQGEKIKAFVAAHPGEPIPADLQAMKEAQDYMARGELVPDETVVRMVEPEIVRFLQDSKGFIFDGFPRNIAQAEALKKMLKKYGLSVNYVLYLKTTEDTAVHRLSGRVVCPLCKTSFNLNDIKHRPKVPGHCDFDGTLLKPRNDDLKPETVRERMRGFRVETSPILDYYRAEGLLQEANANFDVKGIADAVIASLSPDEENPVEAVTASSPASSEPSTPAMKQKTVDGGIDLNGKAMTMVEAGDQWAGTVDAAIAQKFRRGDFIGVIPVIINITPVTSLTPLLGLFDQGSKPIKA